MRCNAAPRAGVDSRTLREKSGFWQDRYPLDHERNQLMFDYELFRGVDTSVVKPHSSKKLYDMSKVFDSTSPRRNGLLLRVRMKTIFQTL
ncbi:hypothetical protein GN244_ATG07314 [Phytophthora infestans]|uniref:Uncharacterized protein n=1 Tax=Phytophthora infestans TaxID=4787 RepID=A0A833SWL2_PHYIN|nr:hypothetical protein GN244_ATG07314 [Phytophthora infestans]